MIYVASSWRNPLHIGVVAALQAAARAQGSQFEPYDFRHPEPGDDGFHWSEVGMPSYDRATNSLVPASEYLAGLEHPRAVEGFKKDFDAMQRCSTCVLVLPCGRSAHLELGWFVGKGKLTAILLSDEPGAGKPHPPPGEAMVVPELMYKMVDYIAPSLFDLLGWLGVED